MVTKKENIIFFIIFFPLTIYLIYGFIDDRKIFKEDLKQYEKLATVGGKKEKINVEGVLYIKSKRSGKVLGAGAPYTFVVSGKEYKGSTIKTDDFSELLPDSVIYLPENPRINSNNPKKELARHKSNSVFSYWRLALSILTGLITIGTLLPDDKNKQGQ